MKPTFFIVGPAGAGKSELKNCLAVELQLRGRSTVVSECGNVIVDLMAREYAKLPWAHAVGVDGWKEFILSRKSEYRAAMRERGDQLTAYDHGRLVRECLSADIVCGVRRESEARSLYMKQRDIVSLGALKFAAALQGHIWVFIERPDAEPVSDSFEIDFFRDFCTFHLINSGDLVGLELWAKAFVDEVLKS